MGAIGPGLLVYLGVGKGDSERDVAFLSEKILRLRIFEGSAGRLEHSLLERGGQLLVVSQFTLFADLKKGRRPSFHEAAPPEEAQALYQRFVDALRLQGVEVATGRFRAMMEVESCVDGPFTLFLDSMTLRGQKEDDAAQHPLEP